MKYKIGTRGSKLALKQTMDVIAKLEQLYPEDEFEAVIITTTGDREQKKQLDQIGSKGVFVQEIEEELAGNGRIILRESGTEPVIRVMAETDSDELCRKYVGEMVEVINSIL